MTTRKSADRGAVLARRRHARARRRRACCDRRSRSPSGPEPPRARRVPPDARRRARNEKFVVVASSAKRGREADHGEDPHPALRATFSRKSGRRSARQPGSAGSGGRGDGSARPLHHGETGTWLRSVTTTGRIRAAIVSRMLARCSKNLVIPKSRRCEILRASQCVARNRPARSRRAASHRLRRSSDARRRENQRYSADRDLPAKFERCIRRSRSSARACAFPPPSVRARMARARDFASDGMNDGSVA